MIWLVALEAAAIGVLTLVVVALAHSYAGLAARVEETASPRHPAHVDAPHAMIPPHRGDEPTTGVRDLLGATPAGERVLLSLAPTSRDTLLAFLTTSCASCRGLWDELTLAHPSVIPPEVRLVIVSKGEDRESPSQVAALADGIGDVDVVMSSEAWADFDVPGSPYFVLVGRERGDVLGQGTARTWDQVMGLIGVAAGDERVAARTRKSRRDRRQELDVDRVLLEAGVRPGDASLYPVTDDGAARA
ncbi:MAG TPA: hypothetical protein VGZ03_02465 [Acidimicrobiales bacterium]|nr:hypothetical protein [Acidimicrobiales bacterium]